MATQVQLRRGTSTQNDSFTGAQGELTFDTTNKRVRIHDGATAGGFELKTENAGGDTLFATGEKAIFGAGSDLQIYHDGANSVINEGGTGELRLGGTNLRLGNGGLTETYLLANNQGAVTLYYDNNPTLATTSTGIDVTGTVTADGLTVDTDAYRRLLLTYPDNFTSKLQLGFSNFYVQGSATNDRLTIANNSSGQTHFENQSKTSMVIDNSGDISFYEATGTTPKFFWDASAERLGLGTSSPSYTISSRDDSAISYPLSLESATLGTVGNTVGMRFGFSGNTYQKGAIIYESVDSDARGKMHFALDSVGGSGNVDLSDSKMTIDSSGNVGIGVTPVTPLDVVTGSNQRLFFTQTSGSPIISAVNKANTAYLPLQLNGLDVRLKVSGTERMRIDSAGNVGIGVSSPSAKLHIDSAGTNEAIRINTATGYNAGINYYVNNVIKWTAQALGDGSDAYRFYNFGTNSEAMRIDSSGNLLVGQQSKNSSVTYGGVYVSSDSIVTSNNYYAQVFVQHNSTYNHGIVLKELGTGGPQIAFLNSSGSLTGSIDTQASSTSYNTSSDYRLKENVVDLTGASARVNQLDVKRFNFIADDTNTAVDGFLAHEVATVVPEAITGTHDEVEVWKDGDELPDGVSVGDNKLDDDGNTIPVYQGIDQSKLVPLLTAALQEALTEIASLKTRVEALEG